MSDLQDVIAANAVKAYNEGFARGEASERERIVNLLETESEEGNKHICLNCDTWLEIKGGQK